MRAGIALLAIAAASCAKPEPKGPPVDAEVVFAPRGGGDEGVEGRVHCEPEAGSVGDKPGGASIVGCSASHQGDRTLTVCFHAEIDCRNGAHVNAESCREIPPGSEIRTLHAADGCDRAVGGRVTAAWVVQH